MSDSPSGNNPPISGNDNCPQPSSGTKTARRRSRRMTGETGLISGIISGVISSALVSFLLTPTGDATLIYITHLDPTPNCANHQWLLQVPSDQIFANSYYIQDDEIAGYGDFHVPDYSIDGSLRTAWLQWWAGATRLDKKKKYEKTHDYITWSFLHPYDIRLVCIIDGWTEDSTTYESTLPIGTATIYSIISQKAAVPKVSSKCPKRSGHFTDYFDKFAYRWQGISFSCKTTEIELHIDSVKLQSINDRRKTLVDTPTCDNENQKCPLKPLPLVGLSEVQFYYSPGILSHMP
jgi:hypothetical protein